MSLTQITKLPDAPVRPAQAHKGTFGTVIVLGGCETMIGAPALCASAALRSGAGLVKVAVPASILQAVIAIEPGATGIALSEDADSTVALLADADPDDSAVLAVGPGWGADASRGELLERILGGRRCAVLDADGLNALAETGRPRPRPGPPLVLTPHPGEFRRLAAPLGIREEPTDDRARPSAAANLAATHDAVVVLKGRHSIVADAGRYSVNRTGNPALATAGSGDILTGVIAALCAQTMAPFDAASLGVHLHGLAADRWAKEHGQSGLTAFDLAEEMPKAFESHRRTKLGN
jgi:NAD(P)H-hydrate epimerase